MAKSPDAFRTISEVAEWLGVEAHVLRFWETRFSQVKPVKRAGGRRYYRPSDMALLGGIRKLLHDEGLTIRGVQKILREQGVAHVAAMSPELSFEAEEPAPVRARPAPPPAARPVEDAPPLPFDLPTAAPVLDRVTITLAPAPPARAEPVAASRESAPAARVEIVPSHAPAGALRGDGAAQEDTHRDGAAMAALLRRGAAADPEHAAAVLARARNLLERLRSTPE